VLKSFIFIAKIELVVARNSLEINSNPRRAEPPRRQEIIGPGKSYKFGHPDVADTWIVEQQIENTNRRRLVILAICVVVIITLMIWH
jgi:hypothetical protein